MNLVTVPGTIPLWCEQGEQSLPAALFFRAKNVGSLIAPGQSLPILLPYNIAGFS